MLTAENFSIVVSAISPILLGLLTFFQVRRDNRDKTYRKLREENEELRHDQENKRRESEKMRLEKMEKSIQDITNTVNELRDSINIQSMETSLDQLHTMTELNFEYIQSLSDTVIVIGNTLASSNTIDESARKSLDEAIAASRKKEDQISQELIKIIT